MVLEGDGIDTAAVFARDLAKREGLIFVHPYDDAKIIAGQGTIGLELLEDRPDLDVRRRADRRRRPHRRHRDGGQGAEACDRDGGRRGGALSVDASTPSITRCRPRAALTIAEGIAVKSPGAITRPIIERLVPEILLVREDAIERAIQLLVETQKIVAEGAGAAGSCGHAGQPRAASRAARSRS